MTHLVEERRLVHLLEQCDHASPVRVRRDVALRATVLFLVVSCRLVKR